MTIASHRRAPPRAIVVVTALTFLAVAAPARTQALAAQSLDVTALQSQAENGDADAQFKLGTLLYVGLDVIQDYIGSAEWLRRSADHGNADAQCELGFLFQTGSFAQGPPPPDPKDARPWYEKAAAQHDGCGEYALGNLYAMGVTVDADSGHAAALFKQAAADGFSAPAGTYPLQVLQEYFYALAYRFAGTHRWSDTVSVKAGGSS